MAARGPKGSHSTPFTLAYPGPPPSLNGIPCPPPADRQGAGSISTSRCHSWMSTTLCPSRTVAMMSARAWPSSKGAPWRTETSTGYSVRPPRHLPPAGDLVLREGRLERDLVVDRAVDDGGEQDAVAVGGEVRGRIDVRSERGHFHGRAPIRRRAITELTISVRTPAEYRAIHARRARTSAARRDGHDVRQLLPTPEARSPSVKGFGTHGVSAPRR